MLVLTRKPGEKIQIGDNITITVLRMKGKAVRLGIQAPSEQSVLRGELVLEVEEGDQDPERGGRKGKTQAAPVGAPTSRNPVCPAEKLSPFRPGRGNTRTTPKDASPSPLRELVLLRKTPR